jgi:hypothetical protein
MHAVILIRRRMRMRWAQLIARMRTTGNERMISARKSECNSATSKTYMCVER